MARMGSVFVCLSALLLVTSSVQAQPSLKLNEATHNFGKAAPFEKLQHDIIITNEGTEALEIINVGTTCGCTAAVPSATHIPAGATSIVSVTMTAASGTTRMEKQVKIISNDPKQKEVRVTMIADVRNMWTFSPVSTVKFNDVPYNSERTETIYLSNTENTPFKVKDIQSDRAEFKGEVGEASDSGVQIIIHFNSGKKRETFPANIEIVTDNPDQPRARVHALATVTGYVKFSPSSLYFGRSPAGKTVDREMRIVLTDESMAENFEITKIDGGDGVTAEVVGKNALGHIRVKVSYVVPEAPGYHKGDITLYTNLKEEPSVKVLYSVLVPLEN